MALKTQQVMRTNRSVEQEGVSIPSGTRVVVMSTLEDGRVKVKVADSTASAELNGTRLVLGESRLNQTFRGRPRKQDA